MDLVVGFYSILRIVRMPQGTVCGFSLIPLAVWRSIVKCPICNKELRDYGYGMVCTDPCAFITEDGLHRISDEFGNRLWKDYPYGTLQVILEMPCKNSGYSGQS